MIAYIPTVPSQIYFALPLATLDPPILTDVVNYKYESGFLYLIDQEMNLYSFWFLAPGQINPKTGIALSYVSPP